MLSCACSTFADVPIAIFNAGRADNNLSICNGDDGKYTIENFAEKPAVKNLNNRNYFYFTIDPDIREGLGSDLWLLVEGGSNILGGFQVRYNSKINPYTYAEEVRTLGEGVSDRFLIHLPDSDFRGLQNSGADFRIEVNSFYITKLELYTQRPNINLKDNNQRLSFILDRLNNYPKAENNYNFGYIFGDDPFAFTDPNRRWEIPFRHNGDLETLKYIKTLGCTSVQTYVTWELCEPKVKGDWDWSHWDAYMKNISDTGMKMSPFVIAGPAYSIPSWFRETAQHVPARCLEHGKESKVESLWSPNIMLYVDRFLNNFSKRYPNHKHLFEIIILGIQGDYGEAIHSTSGGWPEIIPGAYHVHEGFWCDDPNALKEYRGYLKKEYKNISDLNKAWNTKYKTFAGIDFPARGKVMEDYRANIKSANGYKKRQYLDFVTWYRSAMINLADKWFITAKKYFPDTPIYLCTGGNGQPVHGSDFSFQCKLAARHKGGVKITNEGPEYRWNNTVTRLVSSAGRFYGCGFGNEPATDVTPEGVVARMYGGVTSGSTHMEEHTRNITDSKERLTYQRQNTKFLEYYPHVVIPVAMYYPNVAMTLGYEVNWMNYGLLRDIVDHDYLDENMLRDGALKKFGLLLISPTLIETGDAKKIADWIKSGGHVIVIGNELFTNVEGTNASEKILFPNNSLGGQLGKGDIKRIADFKDIRIAVNNYLKANDYPIYDSGDDNVFGSQVSENTILFHNANSNDRTVTYIYRDQEYKVVVPAYGIEKVKL